MQLFDPKGRFNEPPRSKKDAEHARLMREARERKRLAVRTPEQVAEDEARARREWEARILDGLAGEERYRRQTLLLHRRGDYRMSEKRRAYERRKKANHRARKRQQHQAAEATLVAEARTRQEAIEHSEREQARVARDRALALAKKALRERREPPTAVEGPVQVDHLRWPLEDAGTRIEVRARRTGAV